MRFQNREHERAVAGDWTGYSLTDAKYPNSELR
jgi:hypothetical protein